MHLQEKIKYTYYKGKVVKVNINLEWSGINEIF